MEVTRKLPGVDGKLKRQKWRQIQEISKTCSLGPREGNDACFTDQIEKFAVSVLEFVLSLHTPLSKGAAITAQVGEPALGNGH